MPSNRRRSGRSPQSAKAVSRKRTSARTERKAAAPTTGFVFKVALKGAPGVWRRIGMRGDRTLNDLHEAIFSAYDREEEHLYSFYFPKPGTRGRDRLRNAVEYTHPFAAGPDPFGETAPDASKARLDEVRLKVGQKFEYLFDFGDSWWHEITVESVGVPLASAITSIIERRGSSPPQYSDPELSE